MERLYVSMVCSGDEEALQYWANQLKQDLASTILFPYITTSMYLTFDWFTSLIDLYYIVSLNVVTLLTNKIDEF